MTTQWAANYRALAAGTDALTPHDHTPRSPEQGVDMSATNNATRALAAGLAAAALAVPSALADDLRSPDTRDAASCSS